MSKILFLLGLAFCVAGIVAATITETWSVTSISLLAAGVILVVVWLIIINKNKAAFWHKRSTKVGTKALLTTAAIIFIVGVINFLAIRHTIRWDLTENKIHTLSPQTQEIVRDLSQPLKVWVFDRQTAPEIETLLENYRRYNNNFQYEFVNPETEIGLANQFNVQSLGEIHLEYGDKKQQVTIRETAFGTNLTEPQLTNAIAKIKRDRTYNIYFLQGHGEVPLEAVEGGFSQAVNRIEANGYAVKTLNLVTSNKIPDGTDVIVIAGATRKLFPAEENSLKQYLNNGGDILLMLAPNIEPGLTSLLQDWGIELDDRLIIDVSGRGNILGLGPAAPIITNYGDHPITNNFRNGISIFPESRPLKIIETEQIQSIPLVITNDESWAESNLTTEEITFNPQEDIPGPLNIAIALSRTQPTRSRMVIFGSSTFASNGWFEQQLNGDIFLNSINWLIAEDGEDLSIIPRELTNRRFDFTPLKAELITWMAIRIMPFLALIMAVRIWWKRR